MFQVEYLRRPDYPSYLSQTQNCIFLCTCNFLDVPTTRNHKDSNRGLGQEFLKHRRIIRSSPKVWRKSYLTGAVICEGATICLKKVV